MFTVLRTDNNFLYKLQILLTIRKSLANKAILKLINPILQNIPIRE